MQKLHPSGDKFPALTILGSGTCVPSLERSACSALVRINDSRLLFDLGPGTMRRLLEAQTLIFEVGFVFLSHFHPDHTGELVPFLFATKYPDASRRRLPLTLVAAKGFSDFFNGLKAVYGEWIALSADLFRIVEMDPRARDTRRFEDFTLTSMPVAHRSESLAYRIESAAGHSIVYSGDTDYSENLVALAAGADILVCEASLPDAMKVEGHLTPSLAGKIAARAGVGKLVLTHFYPPCETVDMAAQCRKTYTGPLVLARDLMQIEPA